MTMSTYNKWQSRRWLVAIWSMTMASVIISAGIVREDIPGGMGAALSLLVTVAGGYIAADSFTKPKE
jgi:hypothetical protein